MYNDTFLITYTCRWPGLSSQINYFIRHAVTIDKINFDQILQNQCRSHIWKNLITVGDFKKFTFGSKRTIVILLVILLVITIGFYDCLSNYNSNYDCLCCVVCCTGIVLLIDCYMTATKLQISLPLLLSSLLPAGSICSCPSLCGCACNWQLDLFCFKYVNICKHGSN